MPSPLLIILVHGWSVTHTDTYGGLAARLRAESDRGNLPPVDITDIWLSKYVSFRDEVKMVDLARGMEAAVQREIMPLLSGGRRFAAITHSTGGPVVREWWDRFYVQKKRDDCPMSHLVMLAPANFGSALAQLGKGRFNRLKTAITERVEVGQGVLDWLEIGSPEAVALNQRFIGEYQDTSRKATPVFQFVLTGQTIDRHFYDNLVPFTGEMSSDGVVRVPSANLNSRYVRLEQENFTEGNRSIRALPLFKAEERDSPRVAFTLIPGVAHSGDEIGIMRSVRDNAYDHPTVRAIIQCLRVATQSDYTRVYHEFSAQTDEVRTRERVEEVDRAILKDRHYIHDAASMAIVRCMDDHGFPLADFDLFFTGPDDDPNRLPPGFLINAQTNKRAAATHTYYVNHDVMAGIGRITTAGGKELRPAMPRLERLGIMIDVRPKDGFVRYLPTALWAQPEHLDLLFRPNQTTIVDIVLRRVVGRGVFELEKWGPGWEPGSFKGQDEGAPI